MKVWFRSGRGDLPESFAEKVGAATGAAGYPFRRVEVWVGMRDVTVAVDDRGSMIHRYGPRPYGP